MNDFVRFFVLDHEILFSQNQLVANMKKRSIDLMGLFDAEQEAVRFKSKLVFLNISCCTLKLIAH